MFIQLNSMEQKKEMDFKTFYEKVLFDIDSTKAEKVVIDLRQNSGGDHYELPILKGLISRPNLDKEDKLFILTGPATFSASQHFISEFDTYTNATSVGENTGAGKNFHGAVRTFTLPESKIPIRTSIVFHQDGGPHDFHTTFTPDIYAHLIPKHLSTTTDPAFEIINNIEDIFKLKEEYKQKLIQSYEEKQIEPLIQCIKENKVTLENSGINLQKFLLDNFSWWIYENKDEIEDYGFYLHTIVELYPDNIEANYSYARRLHISGKIEKASSYYEKCLQINPMHTHSKRFLNLIKLEDNE